MQTLRTLLEREEAERDQALKRLQHAEDQARRARAQAELLAGYRADTRQRWGERLAAGGSVPVVQCYHGFMDRLQQAIAQQQGEVERAQARVEQCRAELAAQQLRVASVRKLIERRQLEALGLVRRREQKASDEAASRRRRRASPWQPSDTVPFAA